MPVIKKWPLLFFSGKWQETFFLAHVKQVSYFENGHVTEFGNLLRVLFSMSQSLAVIVARSHRHCKILCQHNCLKAMLLVFPSWARVVKRCPPFLLTAFLILAMLTFKNTLDQLFYRIFDVLLWSSIFLGVCKPHKVGCPFSRISY